MPKNTGKDEKGRFTANNQFWKARSTHGRDKIFSDPEILHNACKEYFEYCDANPLVTYKSQLDKDGEVVQIPQYYPRPYTMEGLTVFLDVSYQTFLDYEKIPDFIEVCNHVRQTIRNQKLSGAIAGFYNHAIVARDLKLRDTIDANVGGQEGNPIDIRMAAREMKPDEAASHYAELMKKK